MTWRMTWRTRRLLSSFALAACGHGSGGGHGTGGKLPAIEITREDLSIGVEVTGELRAVDSTSIKPPPISELWDFKIANLAPEGVEVKLGQPIVGFDTNELERSLETMQNEANAADKKLQQKRDDAALARRDDGLKIAEAEAALRKASLKTAVSPELVAQIDLREQQLDEQGAKLALESAKNHAAEAKRSDDDEISRLADRAAYAKHRTEELAQSIERMQVKAPRDGTVVYPVGWDGEKHKVGDSVWRMADVMNVVRLGKMAGDGIVDEVDVARVTVGQAVTLHLDALPDVTLHGKLESIERMVGEKSRTDRSKVAKLVVAIDPTTVPLRPNMRFRGEIETEKLANVVTVPVEAVFVTPEGPVVYRETSSGLAKTPVQLGRRSATAIEVKTGLAPGDRVSRSDPEAGR